MNPVLIFWLAALGIVVGVDLACIGLKKMEDRKASAQRLRRIVPNRNMATQDQYIGLIFLDYLSDLFTAAGKDQFTREEVLVLLNAIKNDPDLIDPDVLAAYEEATQEIV